MTRAPLFLFLFTLPVFASTYVVNDLGDAGDLTAGNDICATAGAVCTLRAAIEEANAHAGADIITFTVAGTIAPATALPAISQQLTIDATSAPGYLNAPVVVVSGGGSIATGFQFAAGSSASSVQGLKVHGFSASAISIAVVNVVVRRNHIGPIGGGTANLVGVSTLASSATCTIGGTTDGDGNVVSGNSGAGLLIAGSGHTIADNFIGTNVTGSAALPNGASGIEITAPNSSIGAIGTNIENVLSGNGLDGVLANAANTTIINNLIGLNAAGNAAIPNGRDGVNSSGNAVIGTPAAGNVISGNADYGIELFGPATVQNNIIGLDRTGQTAIGNQLGMVIRGTSTIGGSNPGEGNTVSGNQSTGISFASGVGTTIYGNTVGLNLDRTSARGNGGAGIFLNVVVGNGVAVGAPGGGMNVISGNGGEGIFGQVPNSSIVNNRIGTDGTGAIDIGNAGSGIEGGVGQITGNLISGNGGWGASLDEFDPVVTGNVIRRNALGGVVVKGDSALVCQITANSIVSNSGLGIDILPNGVTANDAGDADVGPNGVQNYPVIASVQTTGGSSSIAGSLNSTPNTLFALHFYDNTSADPTGFGEGETYLGTANVMTNASGDAAFTWVGPPLTIGHFVTATATGPSGTSEFSAVNDVAPLPTIQFSTSVYQTSEGAGTVTITVLRSGDLSATSSVAYATADETATAGSDYTATSGTLTFAPGESTKTFTLAIVADSNDEPAEQFRLTLSSPTGATLGTPSEAEVEIAADATIPTLATSALLALLSLLAVVATLRLRGSM